MNKVEYDVSDEYSKIINKSFHAVCEDHPHECNMLIYAGLTLLFAFGAYKEMRAIPRNV